MHKEESEQLKEICSDFRHELIEILHSIQTGHPGGSLSCIEILTVLYFKVLNVDPQNPNMPSRDRLVLSKGHAAPALYLALAKKGFFPESDLKTLRQLGSHLQGHPCARKTPGVDISTGALGLGLSSGLGMALAARHTGEKYNVYVILGDGELEEGAIWEAAMSASKFKPSNLIAILDNNGVQLDGTNEEIMPVENIGDKFAAFGFNIIKCDGHDVEELYEAMEKAKAYGKGPSLIIAKTVKGKGISFMEGKSTWHGKPINDQEYENAILELKGGF